jgi:hypothetical protein
LYDHPQASDVSQLTGLWTSDGQPKDWAREFQKLAASLSGRSLAPREIGPRPKLDWDQCTTSTQAGRRFREQYYRAFLESSSARRNGD